MKASGSCRLWAARSRTPKLFTQRRQSDEKSLFVRPDEIEARGEEAGRHRAVGLRERLSGGGWTKRGHGPGGSERRGNPRAALASRRLGVRLLHRRQGPHVGRRAEQRMA